MVTGFYKFIAASAPVPMLGPGPPYGNTLRTLQPATAHLRPTTAHLPFGAGLGLMPSGKHFWAITDPLPTLICSPWSRTSNPAVRSFPGALAPAVQRAGYPGYHPGSVHARIPPDQCGPRLRPLEEGLTLKRWCSPVSHTCTGPTQGKQWLPSLHSPQQRYSVQSFSAHPWAS